MKLLPGQIVTPISALEPGSILTDGTVVTAHPVNAPDGRVTFETTHGTRWGMPGQNVLTLRPRATNA